MAGSLAGGAGRRPRLGAPGLHKLLSGCSWIATHKAPFPTPPKWPIAGMRRGPCSGCMITLGSWGILKSTPENQARAPDGFEGGRGNECSVACERRKWLEIECSWAACTSLTDGSAVSVNTVVHVERASGRESCGQSKRCICHSGQGRQDFSV